MVLPVKHISKNVTLIGSFLLFFLIFGVFCLFAFDIIFFIFKSEIFSIFYYLYPGRFRGRNSSDPIFFSLSSLFQKIFLLCLLIIMIIIIIKRHIFSYVPWHHWVFQPFIMRHPVLRQPSAGSSDLDVCLHTHDNYHWQRNLCQSYPFPL